MSHTEIKNTAIELLNRGHEVYGVHTGQRVIVPDRFMKRFLTVPQIESEWRYDLNVGIGGSGLVAYYSRNPKDWRRGCDLASLGNPYPPTLSYEVRSVNHSTWQVFVFRVATPNFVVSRARGRHIGYWGGRQYLHSLANQAVLLPPSKIRCNGLPTFVQSRRDRLAGRTEGQLRWLPGISEETGIMTWEDWTGRSFPV